MEKKIEILKGMLQSKKYSVEGRKKQIQSETNYLNEQVKKGNWRWVESTAKKIAELSGELKQIENDINEMGDLIDFLTRED